MLPIKSLHSICSRRMMIGYSIVCLNKIGLGVAFCAYHMALMLKLSQKELMKGRTIRKRYIGYLREDTIWMLREVFPHWTFTLISLELLRYFIDFF